MRRLGYTRYVAQGGDVGAGVTDAMGRQAPEGLLGIHINLLVTGAGRRGALPSGHRARNARRSTRSPTFSTTGIGYFLEQATRPQTIGYALLDSPVALAAWMLDHDTDAYYKISRAFVDGQPVGQPHPGPHPRQHHAVLADRHRRLGGPVVLGERTSRRPLAAGQAPPHGLAPGRLHRVPRRDLPGPAQLGREGLPHPHLLQRGRPGRPLRRLGGARAVRGRDAGGVRLAALIGAPRDRRAAGRLDVGIAREPRGGETRGPARAARPVRVVRWGRHGGGRGREGPGAKPLPPPVQVRPEPEGVALGDPAFQALPGARADFGRLGGSVYQVEVPERLERAARALHARVRGARPHGRGLAARHPPLPDRAGLRVGRVELQQHVADPRARGRRDGRPVGPLRAPVRAARSGRT